MTWLLRISDFWKVLNAAITRVGKLPRHTHICHELRTSRTRYTYPRWHGIASCYVITPYTRASRTTFVTNSIYIPEMDAMSSCYLDMRDKLHALRTQYTYPKWRGNASCYVTHTCFTNYMHLKLDTHAQYGAGSRAARHELDIHTRNRCHVILHRHMRHGLHVSWSQDTHPKWRVIASWWPFLTSVHYNTCFIYIAVLYI